jgi:hypothetical protein
VVVVVVVVVVVWWWCLFARVVEHLDHGAGL